MPWLKKGPEARPGLEKDAWDKNEARQMDQWAQLYETGRLTRDL